MSTRTTTGRRAAVGLVLAGAAALAAPDLAQAGHVHSMQVGNGACVLLAADGGEGEVALPFATQAQIDAHRAHPLHLLVHLGRPGKNNAIGVYGTASDPCKATGDYLND